MSAALTAVFRRNVLARMAELGLSQKELAARLGVTKGYVSQITRGYCGPSLEMVGKFAVALDCRPADLLTEKISKKFSAPS